MRPLPARVDGDALDRVVGRRLADRRPKAAGATGLRGVSVDGIGGRKEPSRRR
ncbi:hypothetical protein [Kitasatospora sp. NPDC056531]|uniref:hypothetical protein n=1 Tax=Kitasatospora sp. NPDC056531 TaxID=3345856 RepID=UPI00369D34BF